MKRSQKISTVPDVLRLMQSWLWYNDSYKLFFSTHHTNNPQEYYCFFLDIKTGKRRHGLYRLTTDGMLVQFFKREYKVKDLVKMREWDIIMIQLTNTDNELDYNNWMACPIPAEKGAPYTIPPIIANSPVSY
jgi:hypothetical protein